MSKYTTTLRQIIYHYSQGDNTPYPYQIDNDKKYPFLKIGDTIPIEQRIETAKNLIISPLIKFYNDDMKNKFWQVFCFENMMNEIEYPTIALWVGKFNAKLLKVIDRYNEMYRLSLIQVDVTTDRNITTKRDLTEDTDRNSDGTSDTDSTANSKSIYEDTPQDSLGSADYATSITTDDSVGHTGSSYSDTDNIDRKLKETTNVSGIGRPQAELIQGYRETLIDVIGLLVDEVSKDIFIKIY